MRGMVMNYNGLIRSGIMIVAYFGYLLMFSCLIIWGVDVLKVIKDKIDGYEFEKNDLKRLIPIRGIFSSEHRKVFLVISLCMILNLIPTTKYGSDTINSIFEMNEYTTKYYVHLYPEDNKSKNYKVEADIESNLDEEGRKYHIVKAYFDSKRYITFTDWDSLHPNKKVMIRDDDGKDWDVELTTEKVVNNNKD